MEAKIAISPDDSQLRTTLLQMDHGIVQVDSSGSGPAFVIIHSLLTGPEAFDGVASELGRERTVHRIYLPGFGSSQPLSKSDIEIADLAEVVAGAMSHLEDGRGATVMGNGLGSFVALSLAIRHGNEFERLIASNTGTGFPAERRGAFDRMSDLALSGGMANVADVAIGRIFPPGYLEAHPGAREQRREVLEAIDPEAFASACRALASLDLTGGLPAVTNPTLVIGGEIDQTTPPEMGRAAAGLIDGARFELIRGCGHCPQLEQPEALLRSIRGFLAGSAS